MSAPTETLDLTEPAPEPTMTAPQPIDPDTEPAPEDRPRGFQWGMRKDGTARRKPGRPRKGTTPKSTATKPPRAVRAPQPGPTKPAAPRASTARKKTDFKEPIGTILGLVLMPLQFIYPLDAMAIGMKAEELITAGDELANEVPAIGDFLGKLGKYTPYTKILGVGMGLGVQLAHNHGFVPEATVRMMGGIPRDQLLAQLRAQKEAEAAARAEENARFAEAMASMAGAA